MHAGLGYPIERRGPELEAAPRCCVKRRIVCLGPLGSMYD
jgi:hypothetical protein